MEWVALSALWVAGVPVGDQSAPPLPSADRPAVRLADAPKTKPPAPAGSPYGATFGDAAADRVGTGVWPRAASPYGGSPAAAVWPRAGSPYGSAAGPSAWPRVASDYGAAGPTGASAAALGAPMIWPRAARRHGQAGR